MKSLLCILVLLFLVFLPRHVSYCQVKTERLFYYIDDEECFRDFREHVSQIAIVAPQAFSVDDDGVVWGSVDSRLMALAKQHNIAVMPLIVNPGFDQALLHRFLVNEQARKRAIASLVDRCSAEGFEGIQFDFENLSITDRDAFSRFYRETAEALHAKSLKLSVAVVHRPEEYAGPTPYHKWLFENWRAGYDLAELAKAGDFISVMTYSQHTRRTTPGPSAGVPWVKMVVEYFLKFVPPEKLSLGIPLDSQHWYTALDTAGFAAKAHSWSRTLDYAAATGLAARFDAQLEWNAKQQVPFAVFENAGLFEYVYFENARSFKAKLDLVSGYRLRGFSAWVLGHEDPEIWKSLARISR